MNKFADYIKEKRLLKGYTLKDVASSLGISSMYLHDVENGKRSPFPNSKHLKTIAELYNVSYETLLDLRIISLKEIRLQLDGLNKSQLQFVKRLLWLWDNLPENCDGLRW